jgi:hypothetical protein
LIDHSGRCLLATNMIAAGGSTRTGCEYGSRGLNATLKCRWTYLTVSASTMRAEDCSSLSACARVAQ